MKIKNILNFKNNSAKTETILENKDDTNFIGREHYSKAYPLEEINKLEESIKNKQVTEGNKIIKEKIGSEIIGKNLKEFNQLKNEKTFYVADLGANLFKTTLFKDELRTPVYEIQKCLETYEEIPNIQAGIDQITLFITGKDIKIISKDKYTTKWYEAWIKQRVHVIEDVKKIILLNEICGNAYIEPIWDELENGTVYMNDFKVIPDPSRVYYNLNSDMKEDYNYWFFQVPYVFRNWDNVDVKVQRITYVKNGMAWQETIYGIPKAKNDFIHFSTGWSRFGYYGRSYLSSTINDTEILKQILRNYAMAARYMAAGKKLISVSEDEEGPIPTDELKLITQMINDSEDEESIVFNRRKLKVDELAPTQFNDMAGPLDYVRKDMNSGLTPGFMTPWADQVTYASANKASIPFELRLENKRALYIDLLNRYILENIRKQNPKLEDATFEFGEITLDDIAELQRNVIELYTNNLITLNQALKDLGKETVQNGDIYAYQRNAMAQEKYQLNQSDVEQFDEPYMKRAVQNDMRKEEPQAFQESVSLKESVVSALKFIETDKDFIKEIKKRDNKDITVLKTEIIKDSNIIRLCTNAKNEYLIYNNLTYIPEIFIDIHIARKRFDLELEKVKLEYDNFISRDSETEKLSQELFKYVKEIQWEATKELLEELKRNSIKEGYLKGKNIFKEKNVLNQLILGKIDNLFDVFNQRLRSKIDDIVNKLALKGIQVVDDMNTNGIDESENITNTKDMMKDLIFNQFKTFNQTQSQNIKRILTDGMISGKSTKEIEQELKDEVVDWKKTKPSDADYKIQRIVDTEMHKSDIQLKLLEWKELGITHVKYLAHMDDKVRPEHKRLHNKIFTIDEALKLDEWKEIHCRCDFTPISII